MGEEPDRIRDQIERTRSDMSETVDALGYKADVKTRAKEKVVGVKDRIAGATPDTDDAMRQARRAKSVAEENPLGLAVGAVAVGFLAGMLIPATRVEDERLGPVADDVKERAKQTGQEALERGKQVAQDAAKTAKDSAQEHGEQLQASAQEHAAAAAERTS
jgi:gas vesicle protein